ncbi:F-box protein At3g07870-like [Mercurialis annua]|uniref:F-box protein At3g07870-like n=1 Tax=Mercurialis annua TaxID=3986 RepID=UPI002160CADF|nr:F-box protein At3g07870-like [Mercurialis annua]
MSAQLPQEITIQILIRLPIPSIVQCMCVCKNWCSLITSPNFISTRLYFTLSNPNPPLFIRHYTESPKTEHFSLQRHTPSFQKYQTLPSPFHPSKKLYHRIVGSVHGLLCLSDDIFGYTYKVRIWNPLVKRYLELPKPNVTFSQVGPYMFVLGFGFDSKSNDFKVVRMVYVQCDDGDEIPPIVEVFAVKERVWRKVGAKNVKSCCVERVWSQCFLNGFIHWLSYDKTVEEVEDGRRVIIGNLILLFNVSDESFSTMELPDDLAKVNPLTMFVSVIKGSLSVLKYAYAGERKDGTVENCEIWVQKEYGVKDSWSKMYKVEAEKGFELVLGLRENGEFLLAKNTYKTEEEGELVSYDDKSKRVNGLGLYGFSDAFYAGAYTESLHLLEKDSGAVSYEDPVETNATERSANSEPQQSSGTGLSFIELLVRSLGLNGEEGNRLAKDELNKFKYLSYSHQMEKFRH